LSNVRSARTMSSVASDSLDWDSTDAPVVPRTMGRGDKIFVHSVLRPELDVSKLLLDLMRLQDDEEKRDAA
jgi:hypothetical protein